MEEIKNYLERIESVMAVQMKTVLTVAEAAMYMGMSENWLRHIICRNEIPYYKRGKRVYFKKAELDDWMCAERVASDAEIEKEANSVMWKNKNKRI